LRSYAAAAAADGEILKYWISFDYSEKFNKTLIRNYTVGLCLHSAEKVHDVILNSSGR
jgi:hypothetical protein